MLTVHMNALRESLIADLCRDAYALSPHWDKCLHIASMLAPGRARFTGKNVLHEAEPSIQAPPLLSYIRSSIWTVRLRGSYVR